MNVLLKILSNIWQTQTQYPSTTVTNKINIEKDHSMHEHFLLPKLLIDKKHFTNKVKEQCETWSHFGSGRFKFYVGLPDEDTLDRLDDIFQDAGDLIVRVNYNRIKSNHIIGPHSDYESGCTINIPICGNFADSTLDLYEHTEPVKVISPAQRFDKVPTSRFYPHSDIESQVSYTVPLCFDTRFPHGVTNVTNEDRFMLGCSFRMDLDVPKLRDMYESGKLLK